MNNLNSFIMDGHLAGDPKEKEFDGIKTVEFKVDIHHTYKDKDKNEVEEIVSIPVQVYGGMCTACIKHLKKGDAVRVMGRLKEVKENEHSTIGVVAERIDFLDKKNRNEVITIDVENGAVNRSSTI